MLTSSLGHVSVTEVDGTTFTGLYAADGSLNVYDATSDTVPNGLYHPCGAMNISITDGTTLTGRYANNGSLYVVIDSTQYGVYHSCGAMNITGIVVSNAVSFLAEYGPYGMVMDFTDASIAIDDVTDVLNYTSIGQISNGLLVGPGAKLTYSAPSPKLTEQADGNLGFQAHNLCLQSEDLTNATWAKPTAAITAPSADTVREAAVTNLHRLTQSISLAFPGAFSFEIKADGRDKVGVYISSAAVHVGIDLTTGTLGVISSGFGTYDSTATITALTDGWYRVQMSFTAMTAIDFYLATAWTPGGVITANYAGDVNLGIKLRKVHVRRTPSMSDYIKTTTAAIYDLPYVYSSGVRTGILPEPAATNLVLRSNDFTNASWTKSNMTTALTATGPDGVANSASTLTATAGNATALQAITSASSSRVTSVYVKRRTGSGNIDLTQDNGTTWTTQTVTSSWTRVALATVTSTNPTVGIRIVASGDEVDVWCFQHETGTVATSPIITYGSTVLRAVDTPNALLNLFPSIGTAYTIYAKYKPQSASVATTAIRLDDTTANELVSLGNNASGQGLATVTDGGAAQAAITSGTITASAFHRVAASVEANNVRFVVNGGSEVQDTSVTLPTLTRLLFTAGGGMELAQLAILPGARTEAQLQALGA